MKRSDFANLKPGACVTWDFTHDAPARPLKSDEVCAAIALVMQRTKEIADENPEWTNARVRGALLESEERARFFAQSHPRIFATASQHPPDTQRLQMIATQCQIMKMVEDGQMPQWMAENVARETMVSSHQRPMTDDERQRYDATGNVLKQADAPLTDDEKRRAPAMVESVVGAARQPFEADFGDGRGVRGVDPNTLLRDCAPAAADQ